MVTTTRDIDTSIPSVSMILFKNSYVRSTFCCLKNAWALLINSFSTSLSVLDAATNIYWYFVGNLPITCVDFSAKDDCIWFDLIKILVVLDADVSIITNGCWSIDWWSSVTWCSGSFYNSCAASLANLVIVCLFLQLMVSTLVTTSLPTRYNHIRISVQWSFSFFFVFVVVGMCQIKFFNCLYTSYKHFCCVSFFFGQYFGLLVETGVGAPVYSSWCGMLCLSFLLMLQTQRLTSPRTCFSLLEKTTRLALPFCLKNQHLVSLRTMLSYWVPGWRMHWWTCSWWNCRTVKNCGKHSHNVLQQSGGTRRHYLFFF